MTTHRRIPGSRYPARAQRFDDGGPIPAFFQLTPDQYRMLVDEVIELREQRPYDRLRQDWKITQREWCGATPSRRMLIAVRQAVQRGKSWAITSDQYEDLVAMPCYLCGRPTGQACGLDRIDNARGYEPDNVRPCCGPCNVARGRRTV